MSETGKIARGLRDHRGITLVLVILIVTLLTFLAVYFLSISLTEELIAKSQVGGIKAYYLAEAGINEMVWLIKNDASFSHEFENNAGWASTTLRSEPFGPGSGQYAVTITNLNPGRAEIVSAGTIDIGRGNTAQRIVKTTVYKPVGQSVIGDGAGYADGNIDISNSAVNFYNGSAHSNNNFIVNNSSQVFVDTDLKAVNNFLDHWSATVTVADDIYAANYPLGPAPYIPMPAVDFDSVSPNSLKNRANVVYTSNQFETLLRNNQVLVLNDPITYVTGDVELRGAQTLIINGLLVVDRDFTIGFRNNWPAAGRSGPSHLHINHASGTPAGILARRHVDFDRYTGRVNVKGVIYAINLMTVKNISPQPDDFEVQGALVARMLTITSCWEPINLTHDNNILVDTLGAASTSPTIVIDHWEEEY